MNSYRPDIDGLRAVAVLCVLAYHLRVPGFGGGFVGVDVFFVISGYLITTKIVGEITATGQFSFGRFVAGRVRRLFPALFAVLAATTGLSFLLLAPHHFSDYAGSLVYNLALVPNFYFWQHAGYFEIDAYLRPLLHTWSLGVEWQFYLIWPIVMPFLIRRLGSGGGSAAILCLCAISLVASGMVADPSSRFYLVPFRLYEFGIGAAVCLMRLKVGVRLADISLVGGLVAIGFSAARFDSSTPLYPLLPCLGAGLVIASDGAGRAGVLLSNAAATALGRASYSLYLVHWPLIVLYGYFKLGDVSAAEKGFLALAAIILATALYLGVEKPLRRGHIAGSDPTFGLACALLTIALFFPASSIWASGGWPWRLGDTKVGVTKLMGVTGNSLYHMVNYGGSDCSQPECTFPGPMRFIVIGDSHGRMYYDGLAKFAAERGIGFKVFENGACNFLSVRFRCDAKDRAFALLKSGSVDTVLLSQSWMRENYEAMIFQRRPSDLRQDPGEFARYYRGFIEKQLTDGFLSNITNLVIIGAVPQFGGFGDAITCLARPTYVSARIPCDTAEAADHPKMQRLLRFNYVFSLELARRGVPGKKIIFLDPAATLCADGKCRQVIDDNLVYSDVDHLSKFGAGLVVSGFASTLDSVLSQERFSAGDNAQDTPKQP